MLVTRRIDAWFRTRARFLAGILLALVISQLPACAATGGSQQQAAINALKRANAATVGVDVVAVEGSRSAETLGRTRSGSGVVIGPEGLVLTIGYLLLEADTVQVTTQDDRTLPARVVAYDLATGFGLLRPLLPLRGVPTVPLGSVADLQPGDPLMAVTGGDDAAVAMTQVVNKRPFSGSWEYFIDPALFTSPPIENHSGAAVFNRRGELVGIGSLLVGDASGEGQPNPGNMFVPVDLLKPVLAELQRTGHSRPRPWIGLTSSDSDGHVQVMRVSRDGPAEAGGMQPGDVVLAVDGADVTTLEQFYKKLWARPAPDAQVRLTVQQRGGEVRTLTLQPIDRMTTMAKPAGI
ncbi:S1C family serine protease [Ramlibacter sp. MMS24-I3-19]|uniref:S1C family serine protease n=1 Tax=Ramlibacter sp. MMS24-I3-19 TaxID=3416606 RepID=UPI003CFD9C8A